MFQPTFTFVDDLSVAADIINKPHEDYPARVKDTKDAIWSIMSYAASQAPDRISTYLIRAVHKDVMFDLEFPGEYRKGNVRVGSDHPPDYSVIPILMRDLHPYEVNNDIERLRDWYQQFETIHPFIDGNGRVGGIIIAAFSRLICGQYLVPQQ